MNNSKENIRVWVLSSLQELDKLIYEEAIEILGEDLEPGQLQQLVCAGCILEGGNDFGRNEISPELLDNENDKDFVEKARSVAKKLMLSPMGNRKKKVEKLEDATSEDWWGLAQTFNSLDVDHKLKVDYERLMSAFNLI